MSIVHRSLLHFVQDQILSKNRTRRKVHRSLLHFVQGCIAISAKCTFQRQGYSVLLQLLVALALAMARSNRTSEHTYHQLLRTNTKQQNLHSTVSRVVPFDSTYIQ